MSNPSIFFSATTDDLGEVRAKLAAEMRKEFKEVYDQANLDAATGTVLRRIREQIDKCDYVIHVVGINYGGEPKAEIAFPEEPNFRCSYTQFEYYYACQQHKQVISIVCGDRFPYSPFAERGATPEDRALYRGLQDGHRKRVQGGWLTDTPAAGYPGRHYASSADDKDQLWQEILAAIRKIKSDAEAPERLAKEEFKRSAEILAAAATPSISLIRKLAEEMKHNDKLVHLDAAIEDKRFAPNERWALEWFKKEHFSPYFQRAEVFKRLAEDIGKRTSIGMPLEAPNRRDAAIAAIRSAKKSISAISISENDIFWMDDSYLRTNIATKRNNPALTVRRLVVADRKKKRVNRDLRTVVREQSDAGIEIRSVRPDELERIARHAQVQDDMSRNLLIVDSAFMTRSISDAKPQAGEAVWDSHEIERMEALFDNLWNALLVRNIGSIERFLTP